jgi:hypothetical protein
MKIKLEMLESDIIRAIKNTQKSPLEYLASRHFKQNIENIDVQKDSILIWEYDDSDFISYKYCVEDIDLVSTFIDEWHDFVDNYTEDFSLSPITFCVEEK